MITYEDAVSYILEIPRFTKNKNNVNLQRILALLGNPQDNMKIIHVAGTNGKGSTCSFLENIFLQGGYTTGMFTSPHLIKINERIRVNGIEITDEEFLNAYMKVEECVSLVIKDGGEHPSFFEYMFLLCIVVFQSKNTDIVILETGLGGRLDATNIIEKPVITIITSISMDHMEILGSNLEDIAKEKAGIIKRDVPVVFYGENVIADSILKGVAEKMNAEAVGIYDNMVAIRSKNNKSIDFCIVSSYDKYGLLTVPFVMDYQTINATLAIKAVEKLVDRGIVDVSEENVRDGIRSTSWSGRMEQTAPGVYIDGAHNYDGVKQFKDFVNYITKKEDKEAYILFSVVKEKEYYEMMNLIEEIDKCKGFLVAPVMNARAAAVEDMASYLRRSGKDVYVFDTLSQAYDYGVGMKTENEFLFCVGSLYMVGEIKAHLEVNLND